MVAGGKVTGKAPKTVTTAKEQGSVERKVEQMMAQIATLEARIEEKTNKRMDEVEKKMERERTARKDQSAKIDAIFAFIQQSAVAAQGPTAQVARTSMPDTAAQKKQQASRRPSVTSGWTTVEQSNQEVAPKVGRKRARPQVKKSVLGKQFAKAVEHKRARKRGGL